MTESDFESIEARLIRIEGKSDESQKLEFQGHHTN